ncbi:MAG: hypothetical protein J7L26_11020 [Candidatus Aminicenantes bacterium]|nr:hypothetical protein [Candidatus Aminicenantes bacterium]
MNFKAFQYRPDPQIYTQYDTYNPETKPAFSEARKLLYSFWFGSVAFFNMTQNMTKCLRLPSLPEERKLLYSLWLALTEMKHAIIEAIKKDKVSGTTYPRLANTASDSLTLETLNDD